MGPQKYQTFKKRYKLNILMFNDIQNKAVIKSRSDSSLIWMQKYIYLHTHVGHQQVDNVERYGSR